jgi:hypothetical protein
MKNLLFAALSLVSGFSKENSNDDIKNLEISKTNEFIITGTYANLNNIWGLNVTNTATEDYFYTFDLAAHGKIIRSGHEIAFGEVKEGDTLKITYDGGVSLVYPPKLNNVTKIEVIDPSVTEEPKKPA